MLQYVLTLRREAYIHFTTVIDTAGAANQRSLLQAVDQLHRAVVLDLQALCQLGNARPMRPSRGFHRQHELMMLRLDPRPSRRLFAEMKETSNVVAELGQSGVVRLLEVMAAAHGGYVAIIS